MHSSSAKDNWWSGLQRLLSLNLKFKIIVIQRIFEDMTTFNVLKYCGFLQHRLAGNQLAQTAELAEIFTSELPLWIPRLGIL